VVPAQPSLPERVVRFRARTILAIFGIILAVAGVLEILWIARRVLTWILVALFLALALNPAVEGLQRRGIRRRGIAVTVTLFLAVAAIAGMGALFIPTLVREVRDFVDAVPGYVEDLTQGEGPLGFLEREYDITDRVRDAIREGGASRILGVSGTAVAVTKGVVTAIVAVISITFLTFFMLLEGPLWMERIYSLVPERSQERWRRVGRDIYRTVGGYVAGNLLISLIAGIASALVLLVLGVPFAIALGLLVAILDLIPLAGATLATVLVATVAFLDSITAGIVVLIFMLVYQQVENHVLFPVVYSRTVQLSPLVVLIAVLIGAEIAGILGALGAIPIAGAIQVLFIDWLRQRHERARDEPALT
jgi:predicted PurR-regulated permease PerM